MNQYWVVLLLLSIQAVLVEKVLCAYNVLNMFLVSVDHLPEIFSMCWLRLVLMILRGWNRPSGWVGWKRAKSVWCVFVTVTLNPNISQKGVKHSHLTIKFLHKLVHKYHILHQNLAHLTLNSVSGEQMVFLCNYSKLCDILFIRYQLNHGISCIQCHSRIEYNSYTQPSKQLIIMVDCLSRINESFSKLT